MIFKYKIEENDFLDFHIFTASKSKRIRKKKNKSWLLLTISSAVVAIYFYLNYNTPLAVYFGLVAVVCGLFYPKYFRWRYKRHYKTQIAENYSKRFGQIETLEITENQILSKDKTGESKVNLSEIEKVDETNSHFFLKISAGMSLIIPKERIDNSDQLRTEFKKLGLTVNDQRNWKWE